MPETLTKSLTNTRPKTAIVQPQTSVFTPNIPKRAQIFHGFGSPEKIATKSNPVAIGTKGTVGALIMQEIDYFSRLELGCRSNSKRHSRRFEDLASRVRSVSRPKVEAVIDVPDKKKRSSNRLIPSMCSMVEVAERKQPNPISGFTYRSLKADLKRLQL